MSMQVLRDGAADATNPQWARKLLIVGNDIDVHLGGRVCLRRRLMGVTQTQLASVCGVRFQQIRKYECGQNRMTVGRLWQIAQALDVPVDYFYDGLSSKPKSLVASSRS
jgi:hypothetical protein